LNATRKSRINIASIAACVLLGITSIAAAQAPSSQTPNRQPLNRQGVDALLAEARTAITAGDLAKAEKLIVRTEQAGVRYPLLHRGHTPSKARRELQRVKKATSSGLDPFLNAPSSTPKNLPSTGDRYAPVKEAPVNGAPLAETHSYPTTRCRLEYLPQRCYSPRWYLSTRDIPISIHKSMAFFHYTFSFYKSYIIHGSIVRYIH
jgi:hypothetical protein